MNACDHPHGGELPFLCISGTCRYHRFQILGSALTAGGRGKSKGNKHPRSVWGWLTKGKRTRRSKDRDGNKA